MWQSIGPMLVTMVFAFVGCSVEARGDPSASAEQPGTGSTLPAITFAPADGGSVPLGVEVVDTPEESACGLMHRESLPEEQGMLFVFAGDSRGGFWMRNTLVPLSIAYIAADGRIVDILDMRATTRPYTYPYALPDGTIVDLAEDQTPPSGAVLVTYPPRAAYRYAVEVNQGWYARHGIAIGDRVDLAEAVQRADAAAPPPICAERGT